MTMKRTPEPELMDAPAQAKAYADADFSESNQGFVDAFIALCADHDGTPPDLIDLGCGPGDICIRLARALPECRITGLDAGPNMLELARRAIEAEGLGDRIQLVLRHLPCTLSLSENTAIVSNSLLHHLPDPMALWTTIAEQASPGCPVQVMDLHRPESENEARRLVSTYAADAPEVLAQDFFNSLLAAYTHDELHDQLNHAGLGQLKIRRPSDRHWMVQGIL